MGRDPIAHSAVHLIAILALELGEHGLQVVVADPFVDVGVGDGRDVAHARRLQAGVLGGEELWELVVDVGLVEGEGFFVLLEPRPPPQLVLDVSDVQRLVPAEVWECGVVTEMDDNR